MGFTFTNAQAFNQDIGGWDVSSVTTLQNIFNRAANFNQDLGDWNISNVANLGAAFQSSGMSVSNMDATIRGWADVNQADGEGSLQSTVTFGVADYSDTTAVEYLEDSYTWTIDLGAVVAHPNAGNLVLGTALDDTAIAGSAAADTIIGDDGIDTITAGDSADVIHGGRGDDIIDGEGGNDIIHGASGNDTLTGGTGADIFMFGFDNAGTDTITDFSDSTVDGDVIDISTLLDIADGTTIDGAFLVAGGYVSAAEAGGNTTLTIDGDGLAGTNAAPVTIVLQGVTAIGDLATYINDNLAVL
jgi:Ca2+-binding RTX toxin-like protein